MAAPEQKSKPSVLLIDDETSILELMRLGLQNEFEVTTAISSEEALGLTAAHQFDVIVCDQIMPGQNGLEFLMRSAELQPGSRRIMMTGYINPELLSRAVPLAALSACLLKPTHPDELRKAIRAALATK